ncbi:MAG: aminotransferase class III-fold pyridoxal phosphate-dependent enzyme [Solirubrobacterales bacterium]|nr:aminotransferase class III-fold pyridoxal phosphate-dependent enzyme [Solirubrobacterales bacterium]
MAVAPASALQQLLAAERERFLAEHPRSAQLAAQAREHLLMGVPMPWMVRWAGGVPLFLDQAQGSRVVDADGREYVDVALGDTGAMTGHSPAPVTAAIAARRGITTMMPTEDAIAVAGELARRFGVPAWQFTLSATDANRFALRMCRQIQRRPKVLMFQWCYHGSVDESVAALDDQGVVRPKPGNVGPPVDVALTTRLAEFNDLDAVRRELAHEDVACVLAEPALTNVGMVLPEDGFLGGLEEACRETGTLLIYDETHTISAGPGGCVAAWGLAPDLVTLGKALGAGVPTGAYGVSAAVRDRILADDEGDYFDWGGVGGTLAGNALSLAAARATLEHVLTPQAFAHMETACTRYREGVEAAFARHGLPWSIVQLGARAEFHFTPEPPRTGGAAHAAIDPLLDDVLHVALLNRGVLLTPFHNMALFGPSTTTDDVDAVLAALDEALGLVAAG